MNFTLRINQKIIIDNGHNIDIIDAAILDTMKGMNGANGIMKVIHENVDYYWMAHQKLVDELPILRIKKDSMYRRIKKLIEKGYIKPHPQNKALRTTYYRVTLLTDSIFSDIGKKSAITENNPIPLPERNPKPIGKQSDLISDEHPKDNSTIDKPTIDNNGKKDLPKLSPPSFDEFWAKYDNKKNKKPALASWKKLKPQDKIDAVNAIPQYLKYLIAKTHPQCHASTWINNRRWEDDNSIEQQPQNAPTPQDNHKLSERLEKSYLERVNSIHRKTNGRISYFTRSEFASWLKGGSNFEKWRNRGMLEIDIPKKIKSTINYLSTSTFAQGLRGDLNDHVEAAFQGKIKQIS